MSKKEWEIKKAKNEFGQQVTASREDVQGDLAGRTNSGLRGIGQYIKEETNALKEVEYLGSAAVHYYKSPMLGQVFFITQSATIDNTPEIIVQEGITELRNELLQRYGHKPQRKRSGF